MIQVLMAFGFVFLLVDCGFSNHWAFFTAAGVVWLWNALTKWSKKVIADAKVQQEE